MTSEIIKRMFDACYQAKRTRDMLPPLPEGVRASFIQYLDVIQSLNCHRNMTNNILTACFHIWKKYRTKMQNA